MTMHADTAGWTGRKLYVVAVLPPDYVDAPVKFLDREEKSGPRVAACVHSDSWSAVRSAADVFASTHVGGAVCVYQLTDNTAGVMGDLLEVARLEWTVGA